MRLEDLPHGGGRDRDAEHGEFTVDVESAWGAVAEFPRLRFPRPLAEPDVRLSPHLALHGTHAVGSVIAVGHGEGMLVAQQARNLAMDLGARMDTLRFVIRDRDSKYTAAFDGVFDAGGIQVIRTPPQAPRANAICERVVGTLRRELLDRILILRPGHLRERRSGT